MRAEVPVQGVRAGREGCEERDGGGEGREVGGGDGGEAGVVEGAGEGEGLVWTGYIGLGWGGGWGRTK